MLPTWKLKTSGTIGPDERPTAGAMVVLALQHIVAMFGATVLAPLLMGFDANTAILFSGVGTLVFFVVVGGRVPSYLGSSFAFIGVVLAATGYGGEGDNPRLSEALGGIVVCGAVYAAIGLAVMVTGTRWIERVMPPVVTGAVVAVIGLHLAPVAIDKVDGDALSTWIGLLTVLAVGAIAVYPGGMTGRLPILLGGVVGYAVYLLLANGLGLAPPVDFSGLEQAAWVGLPEFTAPTFTTAASTLIAPVALILVAENLGHLKAVAAMTGRDLDPYLGRAFLGDGLATMLAGSGGGTGVTTYAENIGVMAVTRIYSTLVFALAGVVAVLLGFSPKFGALVATIPDPVLGGLSIVLFGLIAATAGRIWVQHQVDFTAPRNLVTVGATLILGTGDLSLPLGGGVTLAGLGTATIVAIVLYQLLSLRGASSD